MGFCILTEGKIYWRKIKNTNISKEWIKNFYNNAQEWDYFEINHSFSAEDKIDKIIKEWKKFVLYYINDICCMREKNIKEKKWIEIIKELEEFFEWYNDFSEKEKEDDLTMNKYYDKLSKLIDKKEYQKLFSYWKYANKVDNQDENTEEWCRSKKTFEFDDTKLYLDMLNWEVISWITIKK